MRPRRESCDRIRPVVPEVALGIADGAERARVLEHLAVCANCRRELDELSGIADELMELAPERQPAPGFESRALERVGLEAPGPRRERRRRRLFGGPLRAASAGALAAAAATTIALVLAFGDDRRLASEYRATLDEAQGQYFQAAALRAPGGARVGDVFGYEGSTSWIFFVLHGRYAKGAYDELLVTRSGRTLRLPRFRLVAGSWGLAIPGRLRDVAAVRIIHVPDGRTIEARLPRPPER
jgi:Putative zinc-finger